MRVEDSDQIVPLVTLDNGAYVAHEPTLQWLSEQREPFSILACAGKFRTGKSFLLNRFLKMPPGKGFGVGETVQACTRGIWLCKRFLAGTDGGPRVLVLDTEGIDALDVESSHDVRIFALAVLLSSSFAFNSMSHLDEAAIQTLSLMTRVAESVSSEHHAPTLYWVLRDFALQLVDVEGKTISHGEYLEQALRTGGESKCATREAIKSVFPKRHLVTLPRPHKGDSAQRLDQKGTSALAPKFESYLNTFRSHVCTHGRPLRAGGADMTGEVYAAYVRDLVHRVQETGSIPNLEDSWSLLAKVQHAEAERTLREEMLSVAEKECPTAPESEVITWVMERCRLVLDAAPPLMKPAPSKDELHGRLAPEVIRHCRALGRMQDAAALGREAATRALVEFESSEDIQTLALPREDVINAARPHYAEAVLSKICFDVWQRASDASRRKGREEEEANNTLLLRQREAELTIKSEELEEALGRESALSEELQTQRTKVRIAQAECYVQTEETHTMFHGGSDDMEEDTAAEEEREDLERRLAEAHEERRKAEDERNRTLEETQVRLAASASREEQWKEAFETGIEELKRTSEAIRVRVERERDAALAEARNTLEQKRGIESEAEKLRALLSDAQEKSLQVHKTFLEEVRRRDAETRQTEEKRRMEHAEAHARAETSESETRGWKRRVDEIHQELSDTKEETKRFRSNAQTHVAERARMEAEREGLKEEVRRARSECETLRTANVSLENRMAVLEASSRLDAARKALGGNGM